MSEFSAETSIATIEPPPRVTEPGLPTAVAEVLRDHYGLSGQAEAMDGKERTYTIDNGHMRYRIDHGPAEARADLEVEAALLRHLGQKGDAPDAPEPVATRDGLDVVGLAREDGDVLRVVTMVTGDRLPFNHAPTPGDMAAIGRLCGQLARALCDFEDPALARPSDADLRQAGPVVLRLLGDVTDHDVRDPIAKVLVAALRRVQPLGPMLRTQPVHHKLTVATMVGRQDEDGAWRAEGITDVDAVVEGWLVAGLAVTCADLIAIGSDDPFDILPAVTAFHEVYPLNEPELRALWPLIVARASVLAAETARAQRAANDDERPGDASTINNAGNRVFAVATGVHPALMEAAMLDAADYTVQEQGLPDDVLRLLPDIDAGQIRLVELGIDSPLLVDGNWTDPEIDWRMLARIAWETHMGATRYGEYRLSRSAARTIDEADNYALHVDVCVPAGSVVVAPFGGKLKEVGQQLVLVGRDATLYLEGLVCPLSEGMTLFAEDAIGSVAGAEGAVGGLRIRLSRDPDLTPPLFTTPNRAGAWRRLCPSPSKLLGLDVDAPLPKPHELVRGWRAHVYDGTGRAFIDMSGAAGIVGHGHPALADAAYRQWSLMAGGERSAAGRRFREKMLATLPQGLDVIAAIGPEAEMMALAQAMAHHASSNAGLDEADYGVSDTAGQVTIADERQTGFGRGGQRYWHFEQTQTAKAEAESDDAAQDGENPVSQPAADPLPDLVVTGSILPGRPLAVLAARSGIAGGTTQRPNYAIDAVDYAVAVAALTALRDEGLQDNARIVGEHLRAALQPFAESHGLRVEGTGLALDLVFADPAADRLAHALHRNGILVAAVEDPHRLSLRPPLCLDIATADMFVAALATCLETGAYDSVMPRDANDGGNPLSAETAVPI